MENNHKEQIDQSILEKKNKYKDHKDIRLLQ